MQANSYLIQAKAQIMFRLGVKGKKYLWEAEPLYQ